MSKKYISVAGVNPPSDIFMEEEYIDRFTGKYANNGKKTRSSIKKAAQKALLHAKKEKAARRKGIQDMLENAEVQGMNSFMLSLSSEAGIQTKTIEMDFSDIGEEVFHIIELDENVDPTVFQRE